MSGASAKSGKAFLDKINGLLGIVRYDNGYDANPCGDHKASHVDEAIVNAKMAERDAAKKAKDFATSDKIRDELAAMGVELRDTPQGTTWHVKPRL